VDGKQRAQASRRCAIFDYDLFFEEVFLPIIAALRWTIGIAP